MQSAYTTLAARGPEAVLMVRQLRDVLEWQRATLERYDRPNRECLRCGGLNCMCRRDLSIMKLWLFSDETITELGEMAGLSCERTRQVLMRETRRLARAGGYK